MKILYLSASYVPSRRASSVHVMRMCQAMANLGHEVILVSKDNPEITEPEVLNDFDYYGVEPVFSLQKVPRPSYKGGGVVFTAAVWRYLWQKRKKTDVVYARDIPGAWAAARLGLPTILELHGVPPDGLPRRQYETIISTPFFLRLVVISEGLRNDLEKRRLLPPDGKVIVAHDGAVPLQKSEGTPPVDNPGPSFTVGYVGQLFPGKGVEVILPLAERMADVNFHVVGGHKKDLDYWQAQSPPPNVKFYGFISPGEVPALYQQFDILLLPAQNTVYGATGQSDLSRWMSPLKMFEYMATGKAIVSSDLPVLREVLEHERNALLVPPDDISCWEAAVRRLQAEPALAARLGQKAIKDFSEKYTWQARAEKVLQGL